VVGDVNGGWPLARNTLANERVAMAHGTALGNPMEEMLGNFSRRQLDPALTDRLGDLLLAAQVGSLLDHRIAQLAVTGQETSAEASARKLIGVRYRQSLEEFRMELSPGGGVVINDAVQMFLNTRCLSIAGGTEQILLTMAGERLLGLPR
jgi:alkylation response protein AidB-like acyl-CoA dehydrogenase